MPNRKFLLITLLFISSVAAAQTWKQTGPVNFPINVSGQINGIGRVTQLKFHPVLPNILYAASASGGLYKSINNGELWQLMNTDKFPATACASVCIDYTNDNIVYLSTGDPNYYGTNFGIYKTTDGGLNWLPANTTIGNRMALEMLMDPVDHNVLVAVTNDGIWRTINGGASWANVKSSGAFRDMKRRPGTNTLYAVTASQFWMSNDFGITWSLVTAGLSIPAATNGLRIGVSAANNNIVYVLANGSNGVLFKSTDGGLSFIQTYSSTSQCIVCYDTAPASSGQGNYNLGMNADPFNADHIYVVAHCLWESNDGGISFQQKTEWYDELHTDHHQIEINPYNGNELWNANDGGVWKRTGLNDSLWDAKSDGIGATEIYKAAQSQVNKKLVSIGTQDNGELYHDGIWKTNRGGDWGSREFFDYSPENTIYYLERGERRTFTPYGGELSYNSPFTPTNNSRIGFHRNLQNIALLAKDSAFLTTTLSNATPNWVNIYPTTNAIRDLCISSADSNIAYIISNNAAFTRINNLLGSPAITSFTVPNSTSSRGSVAAVKNNTNIVYISCNNKMYRSSNQGAAWTDVTYNLPTTNILKIFHDDYSTDETIFVCTGNKVYSKNGSAVTWTDITINLPSIANITDFMFFDNGTVASKLLVSYYGRGVWEYPVHANYPPVANFSSNRTYICPSQSIQFTDESDGENLSYNWSFPGGTPSSSTAQNPVITYSATGIYNVSLTVTNANGSNLKTNNSYIIVGNGTPQLVAEGFQNTAYPPAAWTMQDAGNNGINWYRSNAAGGFGSSTKSIAFDNYNNDTKGDKDQIRLPVLNLVPFSSARLTFDVAYAPYSTNSYLDSLRIGVSTDCGTSFTYVYTKFGTTLGTAPVNTNSTFIPLPNQWRTDTVILNNYLSSSNLLIAFENIGRFGQQIFIDNINLQLNPKANFTVNDTTICVGSSVNFTDQSTGLVNSWNWQFTGGSPSTSSQQNTQVTYNSPGLYDVALTVSNGSGTQTKTKLSHIRVSSLPSPTIIAANFLLTCTTVGTNYQWYQNNNIIAGATQQSYQARKNGNYTVFVTDVNGCSNTSLSYLVSGIPDGVLVYPNPAGNKVFISSYNLSGKAQVNVYGSNGALVISKEITDISNKNEIYLRNLAAGIYEIKIVIDNNTFVKKINHFTE